MRDAMMKAFMPSIRFGGILRTEDLLAKWAGIPGDPEDPIQLSLVDPPRADEPRVIDDRPPDPGSYDMVAGLLDLLVDVRAGLRLERNFAMADQIRDRLKSLGVVVTDRPTGATWELERRKGSR